ncbi:MAG: PAS domain S-box protein [Proteobacteria bacterium]|nr:PAS domain S-box protein [Pseudomonadota bacterium]
MKPKPILLSPGTTGSGGGDPTDPEAIVRVLFEKSPLLIYISDLDFKIVLFNRALREATGYDTSDCRNVGGLLERFYPAPDYRRLVQDIHDGWVRNEHIRDAELVATIKDGTQRTVAWSTSRLRIGRGPTVGYIAIGVDVTTRRNLQQWVTLFQQSLQHLKEGVVLTDPAGNILSWSGGAASILGWSEDEMQAKPLRDLYLRGERELIGRTVDRAIDAEGTYSGEVELEQKGGGSRIVVFNQFRLDGDGGDALARLTLLSDPGTEPDLGTQLDEAQTAANDVRQVLDEVRTQLAQRDELVEELTVKAETSAGEAAESRTRVGELEEMLKALESTASEASKSVEDHANTAAVQVALAEAEAADIRDQLASTQTALQSLETVSTDAERKIAEAEHVAFDAGKRADAAEARAETAQKALEAAQAKLSTAEAETVPAADLAAAQAQAAEAAIKAAQSGTRIQELEAQAETLQTELAAAQTAASEAVAAAEKARTVANVDVAAAKAELDEAKHAADAARKDAEETSARAAAAEAQAAAAQELVAAAEENRLAAENRAKEIDTNSGSLTGRISTLRAELDQAKDAAEHEFSEAAEQWVQERASLEEAHRNAIAEVQGKANAERTALEEQLSRDILAAEERSEAERNKMLERHEQERKEWEDAADIARAETESRLRHEVEELKSQLESSGSLQPHLGQVESMALVAADTEGRVVGWSSGMGEIDGRTAGEAIGAFIHKDVLRLDKVNWKTLFGKVVVTGFVEQDVTLVDRVGDRHDLLLKAKLVKGDKGQPIGVTEVISRPRVAGSLQVHTDAALGRMARPLHKALETRAIAGLKAHQGASGAIKDLLVVARSVHEASDWGDVEAASRRVDLADLLDVTGGLVDRSEDAWRELRATSQDLLCLETATGSGADQNHRWNELVTRCLHAVEDAAGRRATRKLGNQAVVEGRGDLLVPLVLAAVAPIATSKADIEVSASVDGDDAVLKVVGALPVGDDRILVRQLSDAAGGTAEFVKRGSRLTVRIPLEPEPELVELEPDEDSSDLTAPPMTESVETRPMPAVPEDPDKTVPPSGGINLDELEGPAELSADVLEEEDTGKAAPRPRKGAVELLEEQDDGGLVLMTGEDSVIVSPEEIREAVEADVGKDVEHPTKNDLPDIDELEQLFDQAVAVSPSVLATADEMDAYAARTGDEAGPAGLSRETTATDTPPPANAATDAKTDAGRKAPAKADGEPSSEVLQEMASTDDGEPKPAAAKKARGKKKTKRTSSGRSKRKRT